MISLQEAIRIAEKFDSPFMPNFKARLVFDCKIFWSVVDTKQNEFTCCLRIHKETGELRGGSVPPLDWIEGEFEPIVVWEE